jgi:hypothetical protein
VHFLEGFCSVISSDALGHNIIKEMLGEVHLGEIPIPWVEFLSDCFGIITVGENVTYLTCANFAKCLSTSLPHAMVWSVWTSKDAKTSSSTYARMHRRSSIPLSHCDSEPYVTTFRATWTHI